MNKFLVAGASFGLLAVIIGAFGAHGLENSLSEHAMQRYHTGVEYQFYHVAALLAVGILSSQHLAQEHLPQEQFAQNQQPQQNKIPRTLQLSGLFFIVGILLFSGSLYLYAFTGKSFLGMITPFGGLSFITGWVLLIMYALKNTNSTQVIHK